MSVLGILTIILIVSFGIFAIGAAIAAINIGDGKGGDRPYTRMPPPSEMPLETTPEPYVERSMRIIETDGTEKFVPLRPQLPAQELVLYARIQELEKVIADSTGNSDLAANFATLDVEYKRIWEDYHKQRLENIGLKHTVRTLVRMGYKG